MTNPKKRLQLFVVLMLILAAGGTALVNTKSVPLEELKNEINKMFEYSEPIADLNLCT
jgi:hypothetical protein